VKVARKDTETVINALIKNARKLPQELYQSLTWDWASPVSPDTFT
jgi:IS30 family transposase